MTGTAASTLRTLVVGCGHAARDLHLPVLARQPEDRLVGVVDPMLSPEQPDSTLPSQQFTGLSEVSDFPPERTVVHVCAGPREHAELIEEAAGLGYRRFIVEKPMTASAAEAEAVLEIAGREQLDVLVVANWLASSLTDRLRAELAAAGEPPTSVVMRQHKSRIGASLESVTHDSAFDVEMPHMVALALHLFGPDLAVIAAGVEDLRVGDVVRAGMGSTFLRLRTPGGMPLLLESVLDAPVPERSVAICLQDGSELRGYFPVGGRDFYSQLFSHDRKGTMVDRELLPDETMGRFLREAYAWFEGRGPRPVSDARLHRQVVGILDRARSAAGAATAVARVRPAAPAPSVAPLTATATGMTGAAAAARRAAPPPTGQEPAIRAAG